jgi:hypothetical protein
MLKRPRLNFQHKLKSSVEEVFKSDLRPVLKLVDAATLVQYPNGIG